MATVIENSEIRPPPNSAAEFSLPMVFFDMLWHGFDTYRGLLFFKIPSPTSHLLDTILPHLKQSLSLTLTHFLPLAGNIIHPLDHKQRPILRYQLRDSLRFTVSESAADFNHLAGDNYRECDELYALAPQLPPAARLDDAISVPAFALQVTLFHGEGLCIGFVANHGVADARTVVLFFHAWAMISRSEIKGPDDVCYVLKQGNCLPFFDRKGVENLNGLCSLFWDTIGIDSPVEPPAAAFPFNKVQATFVLKREEILKLKNLIRGVADHVSCFTVVCAVVMVCLARCGGDEAAEEPECFCTVADCRGRTEPPLPGNYFGNCLAPMKAELQHGEAIGGEGFVIAAKAIGKAVKESVYNEKGGVLRCAENWPAEFETMGGGKRRCTVYGSPRFDFYATDFGWGTPEKFETVFIEDDWGAFSFSKARGFEGGFEIGLSKPLLVMDAFSRTFNHLLSNLLQ